MKWLWQGQLQPGYLWKGMCSHTPALAVVPWPGSTVLTASSLLTSQESHPYTCYVKDFPCTLLKRFSSFFCFSKLYFSETTLHGFYSLQLFKPRLFCENANLFCLLLVVTLWHDQCGSPPYTNCSFRDICLAILVFFPTAKAGDTRLAQTHHLRLIRSFRVQRTIQEIKAKLLVECANWDSIQNLYAALLFFFPMRWFLYPDHGGKGHPPWSLGGQLPWDGMEGWK